MKNYETALKILEEYNNRDQEFTFEVWLSAKIQSWKAISLIDSTVTTTLPPSNGMKYKGCGAAGSGKYIVSPSNSLRGVIQYKDWWEKDI